jgi:hypothetical protein
MIGDSQVARLLASPRRSTLFDCVANPDIPFPEFVSQPAISLVAPGLAPRVLDPEGMFRIIIANGDYRMAFAGNVVFFEDGVAAQRQQFWRHVWHGLMATAIDLDPFPAS